MEKLEGKVAIVTGGAMGNGLGIVKVFLKYKAKVVIIDSSKKLGTTLGELELYILVVLSSTTDICIPSVKFSFSLDGTLNFK